jgi:regulator of protease activity HflC (stomatin/prohibitin superfamily)
LAEQPVGAPLSRDFIVGEQVDGELDNLILRRDKQRRQAEGDRQVEELWREGERRAAARRREENYHGLLANERHLMNVYRSLYEHKERIVIEMEGGLQKLRKQARGSGE